MQSIGLDPAKQREDPGDKVYTQAHPNPEQATVARGPQETLPLGHSAQRLRPLPRVSFAFPEVPTTSLLPPVRMAMPAEAKHASRKTAVLAGLAPSHQGAFAPFVEVMPLPEQLSAVEPNFCTSMFWHHLRSGMTAEMVPEMDVHIGLQ